MCLCDGVMTSTQLLSVIADTVRVIEWGNPRSVAYHVYSPHPSLAHTALGHWCSRQIRLLKSSGWLLVAQCNKAPLLAAVYLVMSDQCCTKKGQGVWFVCKLLKATASS